MVGERIRLHDEDGFEGMRVAGQLAAQTLDYIEGEIIEGRSTADLDQRCSEFIRDNGGTPATVGYNGYMHASCISVNHVVTHGIPSETKRLRAGDILNIDVTPKIDGWHGDSSRMFIVGRASRKAERLVAMTYRAMMAGIAAVRPGATLGDLGAAIEAVGQEHGLSTVYDFCGHGIGKAFHTAPQILHYGRPGEGVVLEPGMFFTIEPMFNLGKSDVLILNDGWTTVTRDKSWSAQFEHSIGVTENGNEIFTSSHSGRHHPLSEEASFHDELSKKILSEILD